MAQIHKNLVIGLDWASFDSIKSAKSSVPRPSPWIARVYNDNECVQAFIDPKEGSKKYMAGAAILAATGSSAAIYQKMEDDLVWVCAAANGLPLVGFDLVLSKKDADEHLQSIEDSLGKIAVYGDGPGSVGSVDDLIDVTTSKALKASHLFQESIAIYIIGGGVIAVLLALGGAYFYVDHKAKQKAEEEMIAAAQIAAIQAAEQAKKALEAHLLSAQASFNTYKAIKPMVNEWLSVFKSLPLTYEGWSPTEINCQPTDCNVVWKREKGALVSSYTALPGQSHALTNNDQATTLLPLSASQQVSIGVPTKETVNYLRDFSLLTTNAFTFSYSEPAPYFSGVPDGQDLSLQKALGLEGTFKITTSSSLNLNLAINKLPRQGFSAATMKITAITPLRDTYSIELNGKYRVTE